MKAKRILSLLLTVAMIAACGVTAFAGEAPVAGYKLLRENALEGMDENADKIYGVLPEFDGENAIRVDVNVTPVSDEEFVELWDATPQEYGADETWVDSAYLVSIDLMNLGELYYQKDGTKYNGFKIVNARVDFKFGENVVFCEDIEDEEGELLGTDNTILDGGWAYIYGDAAAKSSYPSSASEGNVSIENATSFYVFAKPGSKIEVTDAYVMYNNFHQSSSSGKNGAYNDGSDCIAAIVAMWAPETVTLGEAPSGVQATKNNETGVITFTTPEENSEIADKYIVVNTAEIVDGSKVTADTRVKVTHTPTGEYKVFGNKMFIEAGFDGEGGIKTKKIAFGIVFTDSNLKASDFTFEIQGLQSAQE